MRFSFTGKGLTVGESLKEKTISKIGRLERILPDDVEVHITFTVVKIENKVEITIPLNRGILRAEVRDVDINVALDQAVDILEKQMSKYKGRLSRKGKREPQFKEEFNRYFAGGGAEEEKDNSIEIIRSKKFALKPMDAEEAVMNMELLGHNFFVFRNSHSEEVNVVYKRNDGAYGLIEPEF